MRLEHNLPLLPKSKTLLVNKANKPQNLLHLFLTFLKQYQLLLVLPKSHCVTKITKLLITIEKLSPLLAPLLAMTCLKLTMEVLEQGVKYVQS